MTKTKEAEKTVIAAEAPAENLPAALRLRLPYPKALGEYAGIDSRQWGVLIDAVWPGAKTVEGVCLAISYCKARNLDPMKRPIHIVPIYSKALGREIEGIWPGIAEVRITATRTGVYAGKDAAEFGAEILKTFRYVDDRNDSVKKELEVIFPEWCRVTVYKIVHGQRCAFVGPKVYWAETYATESRFSEIPNEMWADRRSGQLEKCAEAAALRAAFPEELGDTYVAEEMNGKVIDGAPSGAIAAAAESGEMIPPRPTRETAFDQGAAQKKKPEPKSKAEKAEPKGDPRPEPPTEAEVVQENTRSEPVTVEAKLHPDSEPAANAEPSKMFVAAEKMVAGLISGLADLKTEELDEMKRRGRTSIDSLEGMDDDERDVLRGRWTTAILEVTRDRNKKKSGARVK